MSEGHICLYSETGNLFSQHISIKYSFFPHARTGSASCSLLKILQVKNGSNEFLNNCILSEDDQTEFTRQKNNIKNASKKSKSRSIKQTNLNGAT